MSEHDDIQIFQCLTFQLDSEEYAVDVGKVREVLDCASITKVPQAPDFMLGVINLRGSVVPVVDLRLKFGLPPLADRSRACIIVMEVLVDDEPTIVGSLADSVREVLDIRSDQIEPPPRIGTRLRTDFIRGMGKRDEHFVIVLEIDEIFSEDEMAAVQESGEEFSEPSASCA